MTRCNGLQPSEVQRTPHTTTCFSLNAHVEEWPSRGRVAAAAARDRLGEGKMAGQRLRSGGGARRVQLGRTLSPGMNPCLVYEPLSAGLTHEPSLPDPCRCTCTCLPVSVLSGTWSAVALGGRFVTL